MWGFHSELFPSLPRARQRLTHEVKWLAVRDRERENSTFPAWKASLLAGMCCQSLVVLQWCWWTGPADADERGAVGGQLCVCAWVCAAQRTILKFLSHQRRARRRVCQSGGLSPYRPDFHLSDICQSSAAQTRTIEYKHTQTHTHTHTHKHMNKHTPIHPLTHTHRQTDSTLLYEISNIHRDRLHEVLVESDCPSDWRQQTSVFTMVPAAPAAGHEARWRRISKNLDSLTPSLNPLLRYCPGNKKKVIHCLHFSHSFPLAKGRSLSLRSFFLSFFLSLSLSLSVSFKPWAPNVLWIALDLNFFFWTKIVKQKK